jgi:hypothetical protein
MPIHINLLAEAQAAEELRRRDPVKRAIFIGASLVLVALLWSAMIEADAILAEENLSGYETEIAAHTNDYQQAMIDRRALLTAKAKLTALDKLQAARFLQGNLLNALQMATLDNVQLMRLRVDQSYFLTEGADNPSDDETVASGKPSTSREKITVYLDARDFSANPGDQVNKFVDVISKQPYFQKMLDKTNGVQLARPPSSPQYDAGKPYVSFELECHFPDQVR